jgi:thiol-disulfide isomerase/thioredoxin
MKKTIITLALILVAICSFGQTIDTAALHLLQKSWDKLGAMENISYRMTEVDTMIRENQFVVNWMKIDGTVKKNAYWHIRLENNLEWLVRGDTLYKKEKPDAQSVTFTTDWERHKIGAFNIHNILGTERPVLTDDIASMKFVAGKSNEEFHIIHVMYKVGDGTNEANHVLRYYSYFIDKKTLLPLRRLQYGKRLESGKESVDIYDFSAIINPNENYFDINTFFNTPPLREKDRFELLKPGSKAPDFSARNVRTDQVLSLDSFKGKVVLLDFWYLSCMPCRALMPILEKLQKKFGKERVAVIGINVKDANSKEIVRFLDERKISYPQFYQVGQLLVSDYKLQAFPTTLVLDRNGKVKLTEIGWGDNTEWKLEQAIKKEL